MSGFEIVQFLFWYVLPIVSILGYWLYLRKFKFFKITDPYNDQLVKHKIPRGKCPPSYPFGWYRLCRSNMLKAGEVQEIKLCGRHIAYFRGEDSVVYAVQAYCTHMGANLGGGKVKHGNCIECPFHGWIYDGKTGNCVNSEYKDPKSVNFHRYEDITFQTPGKIVECEQGTTSLQTYVLREQKGIVYIWLHPESMDTPLFEPPRLDELGLQLRGESINYVNCHIQEIPENGADMKHFDLVHLSPIDLVYPWVQFRWSMKTKNASDPDFKEVMVHKSAKYQAYQNKLYQSLLSNPDELKYINVLNLDAELIIFNKWQFHVLCVTGFQVGSATVALYVKGLLFDALFQQSIQPIEKFSQRVFHTVYTNSHLPYCLSAYILHAEVRQVLFDVVIWNKKIFSDRVCYNLKSEADRALLKWRNWYGQFYQGSKKFEDSLDQLEW